MKKCGFKTGRQKGTSVLMYSITLMHFSQGSQFHTVPAGTARIYRTDKQTGTYNPLFRTGKNTVRTGQFRAIPAGTKKKDFFFKFCNF